jgi:hypothetical protein
VKGRRPSRAWLRVWSLRTGSTDESVLRKTLDVTTDMESAKPWSAALSTMTDAHMVKLPFKSSLRPASYPGQITYLDAFSCSKYDLPPTADGRRRGFKFALLCCDAFSRFKKVYFGYSEAEIPRLVRFWLSELGNSVFAGGHFVLGAGCRRHFHTDGGAAMNSAQFAGVLETHGLSANVTRCPHTPSSNGVSERTFGVGTLDVRAALAMAKLGGEHWSHALEWNVNSRNKLATRTVPNKTTGVDETNTPFFFFYNRMPSLKHAVAFGVACRVLLVGQQKPKGKFDEQTVRGKVIGHCEDGIMIGTNYRYMMGFKVLLPDGRVLPSRNVAIDERPALEGGGFPAQRHRHAHRHAHRRRSRRDRCSRRSGPREGSEGRSVRHRAGHRGDGRRGVGTQHQLHQRLARGV